MEKRLPLRDALWHKKQRLQKICESENLSRFDHCKLKYSREKRHFKKHLDNKENLKCGEENQLNSEKQLETEVYQEERGRGEDWFRYLHDAGNREVGLPSGLVCKCMHVCI